MSDILISFVSIALVNHLVLVHVLGLDAWAVSPMGMRRSFVFGLCTAALICLVTVLGWTALTLAAMAGNEVSAEWLALPVCAVLAALLITPMQHAVRRLWPADALALQDTLPLAAVNSAVIGTALSAWQLLDSLWATAGFAVASAIAFLLFLMCFAAIRQRLDTSDVPAAFRGVPIMLTSAAIMSLTILAFDGVVPLWLVP